MQISLVGQKLFPPPFNVEGIDSSSNYTFMNLCDTRGEGGSGAMK